jgi:hypothetical protein
VRRATSATIPRDGARRRPLRLRARIRARLAPGIVAISDTGLAPLGGLPGTWIGEGHSLITEPEAERGGERATQVRATREAIAFADLGQLDTPADQERSGALRSVYYAHRATDASTRTPVFVEPGIWLATASSTEALAEGSVTRLAMLADGAVVARGSWTSVDGAPRIPIASAAPVDLANGRPVPLEAALAPGGAAEPLELPPGALADPNALLRSRIDTQRVLSTTILTVTARPGTEPRLEEIPFAVRNPATLSLHATFWIERVADAAATQGELAQLQYSQTVLRSAAGIGWPSISVATLVKQ